MAGKTYNITMSLTYYGCDDTVSYVQSANLNRYSEKRTGSTYGFGAKGGYAYGYATRASWPSNNADLTHLRQLASTDPSAIQSIKMTVSVSDVGYNISTRYGVLTYSSGNARINDGSKTVTVEKGQKTVSLNITSFGLSTYGYAFGGTVSSTSFAKVSKIVVSVTTDEEDKTLTLSYNAGDGIGAPESQTATVTYRPGQGEIGQYTFTISNTEPTLSGYVFLGWKTVPPTDEHWAQSTRYSPGDSITIQSNTVLYADWVIGFYDVVYNANGGTGAPESQIKEYGVDLTLQSGEPTLTGWVFTGWATAIGNNPEYQPGDIYTRNANATLYAIWTRETYSITYNSNGGTGAPSNQTKYYGIDLALSSVSPTRGEYEFLGWGTSPTSKIAAYDPGDIYTGNAPLDLYAVWNLLNSLIDADDSTIGQQITITIDHRNINYTDTVTYKFGEVTGTIATGSTASVLTWTPPISFANYIPNASYGVCTLRVDTYNGANLVGTDSVDIVLSVPNSMAPTVSIACSEAVTEPAIYSRFGAYVKSKSKVNVVTTALGQYGATIASYSVTVGNQTLSGSNITTDFLTESGTIAASVTVTDSRGLTATASTNLTVYDYNPPTVTIDSVTHTYEGESELPAGKARAIIAYRWTVSPVNNLNDKNIDIRFQEDGESSITDYTGALPTYSSGNTLVTYTTSYQHLLNETTFYNFKIVVRDFFTNAEYNVRLAPTDSLVIDVDPEDGSIGFHTEAGGQGIDLYNAPIIFAKDVEMLHDLEVNGHIYSLDDIQLSGDLEIGGAINGKVDSSTYHVIPIQINGSISVNEYTTHEDDPNNQYDQTVVDGGDISADGTITAGGNIVSSGSIIGVGGNFTDDVTVIGDIYIKESNGSPVTGGNLDVEGNTSVDGNVNIGGNLSVTGSISGDLGIEAITNAEIDMIIERYYIGETTSVIFAGYTTNPIVVSGNNVTVSVGGVCEMITNYLGDSATEITAGSTVSTIVINDQSIQVSARDYCYYDYDKFLWDGSQWLEYDGENEFIWNGSSWQELGE